MDYLRTYVDISRAVRQKFVNGRGGASYIDLFCGPGRTRVKGTGELRDGGALEAVKCAASSNTTFTSVHIGDLNPVFAQAAGQRLAQVGVNTSTHVGTSETTIDEIIPQLNRYGFHLAFLDPFNLDGLPYSIIDRLTDFTRMDLLIHFSLQDLQRNLPMYLDRTDSPLDRFAPGWQGAIESTHLPQDVIRGRIFRYWCSLVAAKGMKVGETVLVRGTKRQYLYWLVFASRHALANKFWETIRKGGTNPSLL
jgi:three-Cys-motif partner protein